MELAPWASPRVGEDRGRCGPAGRYGRAGLCAAERSFGCARRGQVHLYRYVEPRSDPAGLQHGPLYAGPGRSPRSGRACRRPLVASRGLGAAGHGQCPEPRLHGRRAGRDRRGAERAPAVRELAGPADEAVPAAGDKPRIHPRAAVPEPGRLLRGRPRTAARPALGTSSTARSFRSRWCAATAARCGRPRARHRGGLPRAHSSAIGSSRTCPHCKLSGFPVLAPRIPRLRRADRHRSGHCVSSAHVLRHGIRHQPPRQDQRRSVRARRHVCGLVVVHPPTDPSPLRQIEPCLVLRSPSTASNVRCTSPGASTTPLMSEGS